MKTDGFCRLAVNFDLFPPFRAHRHGGGDVAEWSKALPC